MNLLLDSPSPCPGQSSVQYRKYQYLYFRECVGKSLVRGLHLVMMTSRWCHDDVTRKDFAKKVGGGLKPPRLPADAPPGLKQVHTTLEVFKRPKKFWDLVLVKSLMKKVNLFWVQLTVIWTSRNFGPKSRKNDRSSINKIVAQDLSVYPKTLIDLKLATNLFFSIWYGFLS